MKVGRLQFLSLLNVAVVRRSHHNMNCESARLQGRRKYQEDHVFCDLHIPILFYVFDGHAGAEAGEMASKLLSDYFLLHTNFIRHEASFSLTFKKNYNGSSLFKEEDYSDQLDSIVESYALPLTESMHMEILKEALVRTIHDIDTTFSKEASENNLVSGSTATVVLLVDGHILAAHVGDSKALLCSEKFNTPDEVQGTLLREFKRRRRIGCKDMRLAASNGLTRLSAEELTRDHHPDQVDERLRIEACGGHVDWTYVLRVNGQLAVSSSIGDVKFKRFGIFSLLYNINLEKKIKKILANLCFCELWSAMVS
ncbi:probable protein phosphatase 2C 51 isoform X2 [Camellia sinensis]|uniref:probable protein phosphatase 2C 51 isoform X2 n=1 Tax=Camellia sinensis TaxID=4442 RepID=UPI00103563A5|nr:probable protein phosphatase 2C 51 isoform X2 [Camellia sinensis]